VPRVVQRIQWNSGAITDWTLGQARTGVWYRFDVRFTASTNPRTVDSGQTG
jgi:hypothetical protein